MPKELSYSQQHAQEITLLTREVLSGLPGVCTDFLRAIEPTTQPLTRYAYACDLKLFFQYLQAEVPRFADKPCASWTCADLGGVTARDISMYLEYLSLYYKAGPDSDDGEPAPPVAVTNAELGKMRKLSSLRSFYHYLFKNALINSDITLLVDMPKRHEKPIIRLEVDEVARLLDLVESGEKQTQRQKRYNDHTRLRDLAILTLFLARASASASWWASTSTTWILKWAASWSRARAADRPFSTSRTRSLPCSRTTCACAGR